MYNIVITHVYTLWCDHLDMYSNCHHTKFLRYHWLYSPCCTLRPRDLFISVHLLIPFTFFAHTCAAQPSDYLVRCTDLFSLRLSVKKNYNSQPNNSHPIRMKQNYAFIFCQISKNYNIFFLMCHRISVITLCVPWDEKGWKITELAYRKIGVIIHFI